MGVLTLLHLSLQIPQRIAEILRKRTELHGKHRASAITHHDQPCIYLGNDLAHAQRSISHTVLFASVR